MDIALHDQSEGAQERRRVLPGKTVNVLCREHCVVGIELRLSLILQNEYIQNILPSMLQDLENCQKALDGYLEAKRNKFPVRPITASLNVNGGSICVFLMSLQRFYFVSNPALLLILSQGSDQNAVQQCFSKVCELFYYAIRLLAASSPPLLTDYNLC